MQPDGGAIAKHINNAFIPPTIGTIKRGSVVAHTPRVNATHKDHVQTNHPLPSLEAQSGRQRAGTPAVYGYWSHNALTTNLPSQKIYHV